LIIKINNSGIREKLTYFISYFLNKKNTPRILKTIEPKDKVHEEPSNI